MIFTPDSIGLIRRGLKSHTRRPWRDGDELWRKVRDDQGIYRPVYKIIHEDCIGVTMTHEGEFVRRGWQDKWIIGNTYAIQPGRCKKSIGRLQVVSLRVEALGDVTDIDAKCEGITAYQMDPRTWAYGSILIEAPMAREAYLELWRSMYGKVRLDELVWDIGIEPLEWY